MLVGGTLIIGSTVGAGNKSLTIKFRAIASATKDRGYLNSSLISRACDWEITDQTVKRATLMSRTLSRVNTILEFGKERQFYDTNSNV